MKSVESVTTGLKVVQPDFTVNEEREIEKQMAVIPDGTIVGVEVTEEETPAPFGSNDRNIHTKPAAISQTAPPTPEEEVVQKGAGFLEGLLSILGNPESTQRLVNNITETDASTGQTYLKLPIRDAGVVENALKLLTGLFGGTGKK